MTVGELIARLKQFRPDQKVVTRAVDEYAYIDVEDAGQVTIIQLAGEDWTGKYRDEGTIRETRGEPFDAVNIG